MKKIICYIFVCITLLLTTSCSSNKNLDLQNKEASALTISYEEDTDIKVEQLSLPKYIAGENNIPESYPDDVKQSLIGNQADILYTLFDGDNVYFFVGYDVMTTAFLQVDIYKYNKTDKKSEIIYSVKNDSTFNITSAVLVKNNIVWVEDISNDILEWNIQCYDIETSDVNLITSSKELETEITPRLTGANENVFWYVTKENKSSINCYSFIDGKISTIQDNVILNNPYVYPIINDYGYLYLTEDENNTIINYNNFNENITLKINSPLKCINLYGVSDKFVMWSELDEENNYTNQTVVVYNIKGDKIYKIPDVRNLSGAGNIGDKCFFYYPSEDNIDVMGLCIVNIDEEKINVYKNINLFNWAYTNEDKSVIINDFTNNSAFHIINPSL